LGVVAGAKRCQWPGLWVKIAKKACGMLRVRYAEMVDAALWFGRARDRRIGGSCSGRRVGEAKACGCRWMGKRWRRLEEAEECGGREGKLLRQQRPMGGGTLPIDGEYKEC